MKCGICGIELNQPMAPETGDCGGHCVQCLADAEDPECIDLMNKLADPDARTEQVRLYEAGRTKQSHGA